MKYKEALSFERVNIGNIFVHMCQGLGLELVSFTVRVN